MVKLHAQRLVLFFILLFLTSMVYSRFLLSVSMMGLGALALFERGSGKIGFHLKRDLRERLRSFVYSPVFWALWLTVVAYLLSGINSTDLGEWFWRVRTKSPFVFLPLTFFLLPVWPRQWYGWIMTFFVGLMSFSLILVLGNYFLNQAEMIELLRVGKTIPTPGNHIRYSLMLSIAAVIAFYHLLRPDVVSKAFMLPAFLLILVGLHVLAVRTGLILSYVGVLLLIFSLLGRNRQWWKMSFLMLALGAIPLVAVKVLPSFKQKLDYVKYDFKQFQKGEGLSYSDSERVYSILTGWQLFKEKPIAGVGIGDLRKEMQMAYRASQKVSRKKFPHNQYVFVLAGCGIIGGLIFFIGFFYPLFFAVPIHRSLFIVIYILLAASMVVENTIETQVGTAITIFWICFFIKSHHDRGITSSIT